MNENRFRGGFLFCLIINMGLNIMYSVPAWLLLGLHFLIGIPIWLFWVALSVWILGIIIRMIIIRWACKCGDTPDPPKENKNPYSNKNK